MTIPTEYPTAEEREAYPEILKKTGGVVDLEHPLITEAEAIVLEMVSMGTQRSDAAEMVAIARGLVEGDVVGGYRIYRRRK